MKQQTSTKVTTSNSSNSSKIPVGIKVLLSKKLSNKYKPTGTKLTKYTKEDNDYLYEDLTDLCNSAYKAWYMKKFYELGRKHVLQLASIARQDGQDPKRLFSHLLKQA